MSTSTKVKSASHKQKGVRRALTKHVPLMPSILMFVVFMFGPIIYALWGSLTDAELSGIKAIEPEFVGLRNYTDLLADPLLYRSIVLTIVFVVISALIGQNFLGLFISLMMQKASKTVKALATITIVAAWVLPEVVASFASYAFFADDGSLNSIVQAIGLEPVSWLYDHPMPSIILANIWRGTAFSMLIYSAALSDVSPDILDASTVDGVNEWQKVWLIIVPIIKRSIATNMLLITLQTMGVFTIIWIMTKGGPSGASTTLPVLAYEQAFKMQYIGLGTAISVVLLVLGALMSVAYIYMLRGEQK